MKRILQSLRHALLERCKNITATDSSIIFSSTTLIFFHEYCKLILSPAFVITLLRGYMAPEYRSMGLVSPKADVFSLGILILEIVTGHENSTKVDFIEHVRISDNL